MPNSGHSVLNLRATKLSLEGIKKASFTIFLLVCLSVLVKQPILLKMDGQPTTLGRRQADGIKQAVCLTGNSHIFLIK